MKKIDKPSYINGIYGKILMIILSDGIVLTQERMDGTSGSIALGKDDIEKLAKGLFAKKKDFFPSAAPQKATVAPAFAMPVLPLLPNVST